MHNRFREIRSLRLVNRRAAVTGARAVRVPDPGMGRTAYRGGRAQRPTPEPFRIRRFRSEGRNDHHARRRQAGLRHLSPRAQRQSRWKGSFRSSWSERPTESSPSRHGPNSSCRADTLGLGKTFADATTPRAPGVPFATMATMVMTRPSGSASSPGPTAASAPWELRTPAGRSMRWRLPILLTSRR